MKEQSSMGEKSLMISQEEQYPKEWYGQIKFKSPMTYQIAKKLILKQEQDVIMEKWWKVESGEKQPNWEFLFSNMLECHSRSIVFTNSIKLSSFISMPFYTTLRSINLNGNQLKNVQFLSFLNAPFIQELKLEDNLIMTVKSLAKLNLKNHKYLHLGQNPLFDVNLWRFYQKTTIIGLGINMKRKSTNYRQKIQQKIEFKCQRETGKCVPFNIKVWRMMTNEEKELKRIRFRMMMEEDSEEEQFEEFPRINPVLFYQRMLQRP